MANTYSQIYVPTFFAVKSVAPLGLKRSGVFIIVGRIETRPYKIIRPSGTSLLENRRACSAGTSISPIGTNNFVATDNVRGEKRN